MEVLTVSKMLEIEKIADASGCTYEMMLENAGANMGHWVHTQLSHVQKKVVLGLVGSGSNGGDTLVALTYLARCGWLAIAVLVKQRDNQDPYVNSLMSAGGKKIDLQEFTEYLEGILVHTGVILDGIFGTGFKPPLGTDINEFLEHISLCISRSVQKPLILAVDCPSGTDCTDGSADPATLHADYTICMHAVKEGLLNFPVFDYCGELVQNSIGIENLQIPSSTPRLEIVDKAYAKELLPIRPRDSHKGSYGKCLVWAGSKHYPGAAYLVGKTAYLAGAGLVEMVADDFLRHDLAASLPEAIWSDLPRRDSQTQNNMNQKLSGCTCFLLGPGIGQSENSAWLFQEFINFLYEHNENLPVVIDADGLRMLAKMERWWEKLSQEAILTPHPGEMSDLCGLTISEIQSDRIKVARRFAQLWNKVLILKGALTIVAQPNGDCACIPIATSALATAGTGDILAGLSAGFCAQGISSGYSAILAAYLQGRAGEIAERRANQSFSVTSTKVLAYISEAISALNQ